jgi:hypothetical protein
MAVINDWVVRIAQVEAFVESHYQHQISRLKCDPAHTAHAPSVELRRMLQVGSYP